MFCRDSCDQCRVIVSSIYSNNILKHISDGGKELLSMAFVIDYLCRQYRPLIPAEFLGSLSTLVDHDLQTSVGAFKGQLVVNAAKVYCILCRLAH